MEKNFFDQPVKNDKLTYDNVRKIDLGPGDGYTTVFSVRDLFQKIL